MINRSVHELDISLPLELTSNNKIIVVVLKVGYSVPVLFLHVPPMFSPPTLPIQHQLLAQQETCGLRTPVKPGRGGRGLDSKHLT